MELSPRFKAVDHLMCTFGTLEKPKRALWVGHGLEPRPFHEKSPSEREARTIFATEWGKTRFFGPPPLRATTLPPSHPPTFSGFGPLPKFFSLLSFFIFCLFSFFSFHCSWSVLRAVLKCCQHCAHLSLQLFLTGSDCPVALM